MNFKKKKKKKHLSLGDSQDTVVGTCRGFKRSMARHGYRSICEGNRTINEQASIIHWSLYFM